MENYRCFLVPYQASLNIFIWIFLIGPVIEPNLAFQENGTINDFGGPELIPPTIPSKIPNHCSSSSEIHKNVPSEMFPILPAYEIEDSASDEDDYYAYCKLNHDLSKEKCSDHAHCQLFGPMVICVESGYCACATVVGSLKSEITFTLQTNPDADSHFSHICTIPKQGFCPEVYRSFCETGYCYNCRCMDHPEEDKEKPLENHGSWQAIGGRVNKRSKQRCLLWGRTKSIRTSMFEFSRKLTEPAQLTNMENLEERQSQPQNQNDVYTIPDNLVLPNAPKYMAEIVEKSKIYHERRQNFEVHKKSRSDPSVGTSLNTYEFAIFKIFLMITIIEVIHELAEL